MTVLSRFKHSKPTTRTYVFVQHLLPQNKKCSTLSTATLGSSADNNSHGPPCFSIETFLLLLTWTK